MQTYGTQMQPVPQSNWYMLSTAAQAQKVLALAQKLFPQAGFKLLTGVQSGVFMNIIPPMPNPLGIDVWVIAGTPPLTAPGTEGTLVLQDFAGSVFDRGPLDQGFGGSPSPWLDSNGAYGSAGGENLTYIDDGSGLSIFRWSAQPEQPVS